MADELKHSAELLAHQLAALTLKDIRELEEREMEPQDLEDRSHDVELFYKKWFEDELRLITLEQLKEMAKGAENDLQVCFARGVLYGLTLIRDWCEEESAKSLGRFEPKEKPKPGEPIERV